MNKFLKIIVYIYIALAFVFCVFGMVLDILNTLCILFVSPETYGIIWTFLELFYLPGILFLLVKFILKKLKR